MKHFWSHLSRLSIAMFFIVPASATAQVARELVGRYQMDVQGGDILELRGDGTASMAGDETRWSAKGNQLTVGPDVMPYLLMGERLVLKIGAIQIGWKKIGGAGKVLTPMQKAASKSTAPQHVTREADADREAMADANAWLGKQGYAQGGQPATSPSRKPMNAGVPGMASAPPPAPAAGNNVQDLQARQLLTSSAWCSFTYNKVSGTSTTRKVVFRPNGLMTVNGGAETYSAGYGGSYAGQSSTAGAMQWKLENLRLFVDQGDGARFQDIGLTATRNSNGSVILHAGGREYAMCN